MKKYSNIISYIIVLFLICIPFFLKEVCDKTTYGVSINKYKIRVLVIELDPILTKGSIEGISCAEKTASECLRQNRDGSINDIVEDIEYSSNNTVDVEIVKRERLNEFPTYKEKVELLNGTSQYRLDEDTWLDIMKNGWYNSWLDSRITELYFAYDYNYLIERLDLINRRKKGEFDEVWLANVDPSSTFESMMVGKNAYWINGTPIEADCNPFKIMNISISRRDVNFECYGHAAESILEKVFGSRYNSYKANSLTNVDIDELNLWERFTLNEYASPGYSSAGNVHFAPNSIKDYDWQNNTYVNSSYQDWENYPNLTGKTVSVNSSLWVPYTNDLYSAARMHHRWWFKLMPHMEGLTSDGYSNNWWEYLTTSDFVKSIKLSGTIPVFYVGDEVNINVILTYNSGNTKSVNIKELFTKSNNISVVSVSDLQIKAKKAGNVVLTAYRDGKYLNIPLSIIEKPTAIEKVNITAHHYLHGTTTKLIPDEKITVNKGEKYETYPANITGYLLKSTTTNYKGIASTDIEVKFTYAKKGYLYVYHKDVSGNILSSDVIEGEVDNSYSVNPIEKSGYLYSSVDGNRLGKFIDGKIIVTFYYEKEEYFTVITHHYLHGTTTKIESDDVKSYLKGGSYTTTSKQIEGYTLKTIPPNSRGTVNSLKTEVIYTYTKNNADVLRKGTIIVIYKDENNSIIKTEKKEDIVGKDYVIEKSEIPEYMYQGSEGKLVGEYIDGTINIVLIYKKIEKEENDNEKVEESIEDIWGKYSSYMFKGVFFVLCGTIIVLIVKKLKYKS